MRRALLIWFLLALLAAAALALALAIGSHPIEALELLRVLLRPDDSVDAQIVHELRLPRALAAFGTGGLLALAGALMQVLLRNPLADPYVMGASGGAAVGALGAMLCGLGAAFTQGAAFGGALASTVLVFALARREFAGAALTDPGVGAPRLLLAGVMLAALWTALVTLLLTLSPEARIRGMLFWLAGDLSAGSGGGAALGVLALLVALVWPIGRSLNVMLRGPVMALSLGVRVVMLRRVLFVIASLATAVAMTSSGAVGFVGLVVPHALRLMIGNDQRVLLPACALAGGALLVLADTAARTMVAPQQLPVGLVTALLGVPTFLVLLLGARTMNAGAPLLDASALTLRAGTRDLARNLSLRVQARELWCVLGPNGSGKTTLLHTLAGVNAPAAGRVSLMGVDLANAPAEQVARWRGLLTQTVHDSFSATALDVVLLGRHPHHGRWSFDDNEDQRIAHDALAAVDAAALSGRDVITLSGGERQRVAIAALLAQRVPLMLLDEPTAHLDLKHQIGVLEHLRALVQAGDGAAVIALHDLNLAARFASHALVLGGDLPIAGTIDEVMTESTLSAAFDHPLRRLRTGTRWTYVVE